MSKKNVNAMIATMFSLILAACGGDGGSSSGGDTPTDGKDKPTGGDETPTVNEAQGIYRGMTDAGRELVALVLDNGDLFFLYDSEGVSELALGGVVLGNADAITGDFVANDATDINFDEDGSESASVTATYVVGQYLTGDIDDTSSGSVGFTSSYDDDYENTPDVTAVAESYLGYYEGFSASDNESELVIISFDENGTFTGSSEVSSDCSFDGTITPRATGNLFDLSVSFSDTDCVYDGKTLDGIAYHDQENYRLFIAAPTEDNSGGMFFHGYDESRLP